MTASLFRQGSRHFDATKAVSVGLHYSRSRNTVELLADDLVVGLESPEVDGEVHGNMPRSR